LSEVGAAKTQTAEKKYEEFAYVLDFMPRGKSTVIKGREGPIVQAIGEERLTLLELLAVESADLDMGERVKIGKEGREKIESVLGKLTYEELTPESVASLPGVVESLVKTNEPKYVAYFNELQPLTPRLHGLELIPGIGKTFMREILDMREKQPFASFDDLQHRVGLRDPAKLIAKRIVEELSGDSRINLFIKR
jgi:putative nucleotide binding protein